MYNEEEVFFQCPYCAQRISFLIEILYGNQSYIEDCEVCCQPIQVKYHVEDGVITSYQVDKAD